jgi:hypothetical protein
MSVGSQVRERLLTIDEVADWLRLSPKGVRTLMDRGKLRRGVHYVRPAGIATRFKETAIKNWLDEQEQNNRDDSSSIKMVKGYRMK